MDVIHSTMISSSDQRSSRPRAGALAEDLHSPMGKLKRVSGLRGEPIQTTFARDW